MLIYEHNNQRAVIYDEERKDLLPEGAEIIKIVGNEKIDEIKQCTLGELQEILGIY